MQKWLSCKVLAQSVSWAVKTVGWGCSLSGGASLGSFTWLLAGLISSLQTCKLRSSFPRWLLAGDLRQPLAMWTSPLSSSQHGSQLPQKRRIITSARCNWADPTLVECGRGLHLAVNTRRWGVFGSHLGGWLPQAELEHFVSSGKEHFWAPTPTPSWLSTNASGVFGNDFFCAFLYGCFGN